MSCKYTKLIFQLETRKFERGIAEKQKMFVITCVMHEIRVLALSLDGWRIGRWNKYRASRRGSSAMSPPIFASVGNDDFLTNYVLKSRCFWVFAGMPSRSSRNIKISFHINILFFFCACSVVSGLVPPNFESEFVVCPFNPFRFLRPTESYVLVLVPVQSYAVVSNVKAIFIHNTLPNVCLVRG